MRLHLAISEFMNGYFTTNDRSEKTKCAYRSDLEQFAKCAGLDVEIGMLSAILIERWIAHLQEKHYSPASMRRKVVVIKVFCSYWVRKGELRESPFWRVKLSFGRIRQLPRILTELEMRTLLVHASRNHDISTLQRKGSVLAQGRNATASGIDYREIRNLALIDLMFATGMRVGEVSTLDVVDFVVTESCFRVHGKGGRDRLAFLVDDQSVTIQQKHLEARSEIRSQSSALFLNALGDRLSTQGIANTIAKFREAAGISRHVTPHMLRHTVATLLLRNGVDIRVVQEFLGHASIATTQRYTHVVKEHLIAELRRHHPSFGMRLKA